jgi:hypothetical protein
MMVYFNNGYSFGNKDPNYILQPGEVVLPEGATIAQIAAAFPNYAAGDPTLVVPVPASVTRRQYYMQGVVMGWFTQAQALALIQLGTIPPATLSFINTMPIGQQFAAMMYIVGANTYERNNPLLKSMTAAGGISSATMDAFFRAAALL